MLIRTFAAATFLLVIATPTTGLAAPAQAQTPFKASITLRPVAVILGVNATQIFQAEVNTPEGSHAKKQPVSWRVVEPEGGTITPTGLYTSPAKPGLFHVEVKRQDFPDAIATATVTVK